MPRLIWTENALFCVRRLHRFLKEKNPEAAKKAVETIREGVDALESSPYSGKPVEYMGENYRTSMVNFGKRGYVILYKMENNEIAIISVKHYLELEFII